MGSDEVPEKPRAVRGGRAATEAEAALEDAFRRLGQAIEQDLPTWDIHREIDALWDDVRRRRARAGEATA